MKKNTIMKKMTVKDLVAKLAGNVPADELDMNASKSDLADLYLKVFHAEDAPTAGETTPAPEEKVAGDTADVKEEVPTPAPGLVKGMKDFLDPKTPLVPKEKKEVVEVVTAPLDFNEAMQNGTLFTKKQLESLLTTEQACSLLDTFKIAYDQDKPAKAISVLFVNQETISKLVTSNTTPAPADEAKPDEEKEAKKMKGKAAATPKGNKKAIKEPAKTGKKTMVEAGKVPTQKKELLALGKKWRPRAEKVEIKKQLAGTSKKWTKEEIKNIKSWQTLKMMASSIGVNSFGKGRPAIEKMMFKALGIK